MSAEFSPAAPATTRVPRSRGVGSQAALHTVAPDHPQTFPSRRVVPSSPRLDLRVRVVRARRRLVLDGEFDMAGVERFAAAAAPLADGSGDVTVDLEALQFIDAAGLGALVTLRSTVMGGGRTLRLRRPTPFVTRVFEAGGLLEMVPAADRPRDTVNAR